MTVTEHNRWQLELKSDNLDKRVQAAENLSYLGQNAAFAAAELVEACADEESVREWAVAALEELGNPPTDCLESLAKLTQSQNPLVAYWAITLLGRLGTEAKSAQALLVQLLQDTSKDVSVRERLVWALGKMGPAARTAIPVLEQLRDSGHARLARLAEQAIVQLTQS